MWKWLVVVFASERVKQYYFSTRLKFTRIKISLTTCFFSYGWTLCNSTTNWPLRWFFTWMNFFWNQIDNHLLVEMVFSRFYSFAIFLLLSMSTKMWSFLYTISCVGKKAKLDRGKQLYKQEANWKEIGESAQRMS